MSFQTSVTHFLLLNANYAFETVSIVFVHMMNSVGSKTTFDHDFIHIDKHILRHFPIKCSGMT